MRRFKIMELPAKQSHVADALHTFVINQRRRRRRTKEPPKMFPPFTMELTK